MTTLKIGNIITKPEHDPYVNIEGIVSRTYLKLDPRDRTVWVEQEYQDNATPIDEWNGLILTWCVNSHPKEEAMRQWIEENSQRLEFVCNTYEAEWNGHNHVGRVTNIGNSILEEIQYEFDNDAGPQNFYEVWTVETWLESVLDEIQADTTDEQLSEMAESWEPDSSTVILGDILEYATQHRDNLKSEQDEE